MKFVVLLLAVLALLWLLRGARRRDGVPPPVAKPDAPEEAQKMMVRCAQCGIHLPQHEALPGRGGVFCGEPHRALFESGHPAP